jgi:hypothetical protein
MKHILFRIGWWLVQRYKPKVFGVWMPIPPGSGYAVVHKHPSTETSDPLNLYETVGIKLVTHTHKEVP